MDGTGAVLYPGMPVHLDSLLAGIWFTNNGYTESITSFDVPDDPALSLKKWHIENEWGWCASALFPVNPFEALHYRRKRTNIDRVELTQGRIILDGLKMGNRNNPMPLVLCTEIIGYAAGDKEGVQELCRGVRNIGKDFARGKGRVNSFEIEEIEQNFSLWKDGKAMRYLPKKDGTRIGRIRPPYYNVNSMVKSCFVLEAV